MAAITMSMDREAMRYAATVQTNGHRVEMITPATWRVNMIPIFNQWIQRVGGGKGPQHIYYFRDGVSEGQFQHVLDQEVKDIRAAINEKYNGAGNNVSTHIHNLTIADSRIDQVHGGCLHQASSHPVLPQGR